jgi:predicted PurR-regulated permease PerM
VTRPLTEQPIVRWGVVAWAVVGLVVALVLAAQLVAALRLVIVPLAIALFPAALLAPVSERLRQRIPDAVAALVVVVGFLVGLFGVLGLLGWLIANELTAVVDTLEQSYADVRTWAEDAFNVDLPAVDQALDRVREWARGENGVGQRATSAAATGLEVVSSVLFGIVALFFYLKDGDRLAGWLRDLFPTQARRHVDEIGRRVWFTLGAYFRGQIVVATVDAVFIGLGLFVLGVPLALPLSILVLIGGLFPIVGAFTAGAVAVLIALADGGIALALAVLALNVVVQQVEGNVLEPLIVGRATQLHPLAVIVALTAGAVTLGILGAFLAVPVAASLARAVGYLRNDVRDPVTEEMDDASTAAARSSPH